jgi:autotransporter-associated beta strand protein
LGGLKGGQNLALTNTTPANVALTVGGNNQSTTYSGALSGGGSLTKTGTGTLILAPTANNTYSGKTTISGGALRATDGTAGSGIVGVPSASNVSLGGGIFETGANITRAIGASGASTLQMTAGTDGFSAVGNNIVVNLTGTLTWGTAPFAPTILKLNSASATNNLTFQGGFSLGTAARTIQVDANTAEISGVISSGAGGALTKTGDGTLILSNANTYTGTTTISAGTLQLGAAGSGANSPLGTTAAGTTVSATGAALDLNGFTLATAEALTLNGTGVSSGGALTNSSATAATYAGLLKLGSASSIVANNGNIVLSNAGTITGATFGLTLDGTAAGSSIASIIGTTTGTLTKSGTGTWTLSGTAANTYSGATTVNAGELDLNKTAGVNAIAGALAIGDGTGGANADSVKLLAANQIANTAAVTINSSGKFDLNNNAETIGSLADAGAGGGNVNLGNATLTFGDATGSLTFSGVIAGTGALTKQGSGTEVLSGANTFAGPVTVNAGTLSIATITDAGVAGPLGQSQTGDPWGTPDVRLGSATTVGTLRYTGGTASTNRVFGIGASGDNSTLGGTIQVDTAGTILTLSGLVYQANQGLLTKTGAGTLVLSGTDDNNGLGVIANAGTVVLAKTSNGGVHALGGAGFTLDGGTVQLGGTGGDQIYDWSFVTVNTGTFDFNGFSESLPAIAGSGGTILNNGGGASTMTVGADNGSQTYYGVIANNTSGGGTMALVKTGTGTQTLRGTNTYTGGTTVEQGTLTLNYATVASKLADTGVLTLSGGTLNLASGLSAHIEVVGSTTIAAGDSSVTQSSGTSILRHNVITRNIGGTVNYGEASIAQADGTITVNSIVPWATIAGANWATKTTAGDAAISTYSTYTTTMPASGNNSTVNYSVTGSDTVTGDLQVNSLKLTTSAGGQSLAISSGVTFTLSGSGLLFIGANPYTISGGNLTAGGNAGAPYEVIVHQYGAGTLTISSAIQNNGVNATALTQSGTGTLTLSGTNTYTGATFINTGTLTVSGGNGIGDSSAVTLANKNGAILNLSGNETIGSLAGGGTTGGNVTLNANTLTAGGDNTSTTYAGIISGTNGGLTKQGAGTLALSGANTYTGATNVNAGTLLVNNTTGSGTGTGAVNVGINGTLGGTGAISGAVTINSGGHYAPGASVGDQSVGSLTLSSGSILDFEFSGTANDRTFVTISGGLTINGGGFNLYDEDTTDPFSTDGTYQLINYSGAITGAVSNLSVLNPQPGKGYAFSAASNWVQLLIGTPAFDFTPATSITFNVLRNAALPSEDVTLTNTGTGPGVATFAVSDPAFSTPAPTGSVDPGNTGTSTLSLASTAGYQTVTGQTLSVTPAGTSDPSITIGANVGNATADMSNSAVAFGTALTAEVAQPESYATLESMVTATSGSGGAAKVGSTATILAGINEGSYGSNPAIVSMAWRTRTLSEAYPTHASPPVPADSFGLVSDVVNLTGMDDGTGLTDIFVLQMTYDPTLMVGVGDEDALASAGKIYLAWLDPDGAGPGTAFWKNAVQGNHGGTATFAGVGAWSDYGTAGLSDDLGRWGVDLTDPTHTAWAVVNHNSQFAVVPEPATLVLMGLGGLGLILGRKRR